MAFGRGKKGKRNDPRKGVKRKHSNMVDELDLSLLKEKVDKLSKTLDSNGRPKPLSENQFKQIVRSAIREKWMYCPQKLAFLERKKLPDRDPNSRRLWCWKCNICGELFAKEDVDVDHIKGSHTFTKLEEAYSYAQAILDKGGDGDLQILCNTTCHPVKSPQEERGCTWEEAVVAKRYLAWKDSMEKPKAENQKRFLRSKGFTEDEITNDEKREACYLKYLKRG